MLRSLDIRDMLIIDRLELEFQPGLNVLTGETGAGKSILLDALGFVLGWRGRAELVRAGAAQGEVVAVFDLAPDHPARAVLAEAGLPETDELILRRVNSRDGRKTAYVNDRRASGEVLRQLSDTLVELHGQHDDRGLLDPRGHRRVLDAFAGAEELGARCRAAWAALGSARRALADQTAAVAELAAEEEFLRHAVAELQALQPEPGEDARLDAQRRRMQAGERVREDLARALAAMGSDGAEGPLLDALRWSEDANAALAEGLNGVIAALERCLGDLATAQGELADVIDGLQFNPLELEEVEERLFALRGLARKHDVLPDALADLTQTLAARLAALDASGATLAECEAEVAGAEANYAAAAAALSAARSKAAARLDGAMQDELAPLKMERAIFSTELTPAPAGPEGTDGVQFVVATNPGAPSGPLNKIASGGELSRFLLALKVCLTGQATGLTMIFDEIDRGVGGATADAVGRRLAGIAANAQVLVVTHSPQVAALGAHHWRVEKSVAGDETRSTVVPLDPAARVGEIARMLSGDTITPEARAAAASLLGEPGSGTRAAS